MKLGKDILWVEIFTNWQNILMTWSSCWRHQNETAEKKQIFQRFGSKMIKDRPFIVAMVTNSWGSAWAKNHDLREEKLHFLKIANKYCIFELRFEIKSLNYPLHQILACNPSKNKETMTTFYFLSCRNIKMTIMMSYFGIRDDVIKIF